MLNLLKLNNMDINKIIDQTFLKAGASDEEVSKVAEEAKRYGFRGFCVLPEHTKIAKDVLKNSSVKVTTLIDEPTGASSHETRMKMIQEAKEAGSDEIDVVMKIDDFKNGKEEEVLADLKEICKVLPTKVIIGSGYLTDEEIKKASELVKDAGAICVKTATTADPLDNSELDEKAKHIRIMRASAPGILVKASGGIKNLANVLKMVEAGADIIGTSSGVSIVDESKGAKGEAKKDGRIIE